MEKTTEIKLCHFFDLVGEAAGSMVVTTDGFEGAICCSVATFEPIGKACEEEEPAPRFVAIDG